MRRVRRRAALSIQAAEMFIACLESKGDSTDEQVQEACAREVDPSYRALYGE